MNQTANLLQPSHEHYHMAGSNNHMIDTVCIDQLAPDLHRN